MTPESNTGQELSLDAPGNAPAAIPEIRPMYWSVRRELWENRSIYIAPLVVAGVFLLGFLLSTITLPRRMEALPMFALESQRSQVVMPYGIAASMIILTGFIVGVFYCLDALNSERRDRSILFWKSLPVSDRTTVLAKASIPFVVLPLLAFAVSLAVQWIMLLLSTAVLLGNGIHPATLWTRLPWFQMSLAMLYGLTAHVLWYTPIYAWLLLVSAWARRAAFLWAVLPFLVAFAVERVAFGTTHLAAMMRYRFGGAMTEAFVVDPRKAAITQLSDLDPSRFLSSPGLWLGLVFAAACLAAAVRLRRYREPI
jgi:ABC-2 type transport system permease protein